MSLISNIAYYLCLHYQVEAELQSAKNSMLWGIEQGRLAFWHKAEKCFRNNSCEGGTIGSFFEVLL